MSTTVSADLDENTCNFFYKNIPREITEWILWDRGCLDGMFLLRESMADYVLSLCYRKSILHYKITKLPGGGVMLHGLPDQRFASMCALLAEVDGLVTKPSLPCNRAKGCLLPPNHWGVTLGDIRAKIIERSRDWGLGDLHFEESGSNQLLSTSESTKSLILKTLHEVQPWFHGNCSRLEADRRILESGQKEGTFLIRERDDRSYALCVSHEGNVKHYRIDILPSGDFAIQDGQPFSSILALVSHYTLFSDGLWCSLSEPCPRPVHRNGLISGVPGGQLVNGDIILRPINSANLPANTGTLLRRASGSVSGSPAIERNHNLINSTHNQFQLTQSIYGQHNGDNNNGACTLRRILVHGCASGPGGQCQAGTGSQFAGQEKTKLREWLSSINHKWMQLLSRTAARSQCHRIHHFSTLPRNSANGPHGHPLPGQSNMAACSSGHPNISGHVHPAFLNRLQCPPVESLYYNADQVASLNFRSLNVEMSDRQAYGPLRVNYGLSESLVNRGQSLQEDEQRYATLPMTTNNNSGSGATSGQAGPKGAPGGPKGGPGKLESAHYQSTDLFSSSPPAHLIYDQETDLFASPPPHLLYDPSVATLWRGGQAIKPLPRRRVSFADQHCAADGLDYLPTPFCATGLLKSASLESLTPAVGFLVAADEGIYQVPRMPPVPRPRKRRHFGPVKSEGLTYANQETIATHARKMAAAEIQRKFGLLTFRQAEPLGEDLESFYC
ncbi:Tyrosine-protein kinase SYK [Halotydeus destructor]|nr:Tyrosine-protein kinase SYK [Halotydeus destructor]